MNTNSLEKLLVEFHQLPKTENTDITFMDICRHSKSRFEEICSRILAFYIQPSNEHGLDFLLINSILSLFKEEDLLNYNEKIFVETEARTIGGKSLDILVNGCSFVIGIENKINSEVYNPLDEYSELVKSFKKDKEYKIVLSLRQITKSYELKSISDNGFCIIYYNQLFESIKKNVGSYYTNANPKYITFLFDFIQTIENMMKSTKIDDPQSVFFFKHNNEIEEMIEAYNEHKNRVLRIQQNVIATIKDEISLRTNADWWAYQGWDLGYSEFDKNKPRIGIESHFVTKDNDPLKKFEIYITTWNLKDWSFYREEVLKKYAGDMSDLDEKTDNRAFLCVATIINNDGIDYNEVIIEKLAEHYHFLKTLVESK